MWRLACAVVALVLGGTACGDDEDRLSAEEFRTQANELCADFGAADDDAAQEFFGDDEPSAEEVAAFFEESALPRVRALLDDLDELVPPESLEQDVEDLLDDARAALAEVEQAVEEDPEAFLAGEDPFAEVDARAVELGLDNCADDS